MADSGNRKTRHFGLRAGIIAKDGGNAEGPYERLPLLKNVYHKFWSLLLMGPGVRRFGRARHDELFYFLNLLKYRVSYTN